MANLETKDHTGGLSQSEKWFDEHEKHVLQEEFHLVENEVLQQYAIRGVEELGDGRCKLPYNWKGVERNFYLTRTYNPDGFFIEITKIVNGKEVLDEDSPCNGDIKLVPDESKFSTVLGEVLDEVIADPHRATIPEKGKDAYQVLFERATEFDGIVREVEHIGLNKVLLPYDLGDKQCDIVFTRVPSGEVEVMTIIREIPFSKQTLRVYDSVRAPIAFSDFDMQDIGDILDDIYGSERPLIPRKAKKVLKKLADPKINRVFTEADFRQYEVGKYTYGTTLSYYNNFLKARIAPFFGNNIPVAEHFSIILNAVLDYNKGIFPARHPEKTDDFFLPKQLEFYQKYINQVSVNTFSGSVSSLSHKELIGFNDKVDYLLTHGRNGFMKVGNMAEENKKNYNHMKYSKEKLFDQKVPGMRKTFYQYVKDEINKSPLSSTMKKMILRLPMQESSFRNAYVSGHKFKEAQYFWQFIASTARRYKLKVKGKKVDERKDVKKSTTAALTYFSKLYKDIETDKNFQDLLKKYKINDRATKDMLISFFAINGYNSGEAHMIRAFEVMKKKDTNRVDKFVKKYGQLGLILYVTNEYPKHAKIFQKGMKPKYLIHSPEYVYNILKYVQLDSE